MQITDKALVQKLALVVILKLTLLGVLWWFFVKNNAPTVTAQDVSSQLLSPVSISNKGNNP